jgi:hydroxymethylpyrimidine/phosphomethylpyrimidine kinase
MTKPVQQPIALTIAGSDSGGGAGIQADLKTFASLSVHGASAITCLTAQNPKGVIGVQAARPLCLRQQLEAIFAELRPAAAKTGMLYSTELIRVVIDFFSHAKRPPLIVDPVMVATSGSRLLKPSAIRWLQEGLLPLATLVTPNLPEAEILLSHRIRDLNALRAAARELVSRYACAALVKGGHLEDGPEAIDFFFDGRNELMLTAPRVAGISSHGTGCTYSAAIAGHLALGCDLPCAVQMAKEYITQAIAQSVHINKHSALNWFWASGL